MNTPDSEPQVRCTCWNAARRHDLDCRVHGLAARREREREASDPRVTDRVASWTRDGAVERRG